MIPWTYLVPCKGYFKGLRIYRACPEIRSMMNEHYRLSLVGFLLTIPMLPIVIPLIILEWIGDRAERLLDRINSPAWPYFRRSREMIETIHRVLPPQEIRRRIED